MSYADKPTVSALSGIAEADINQIFLDLADNAVHRICNRESFDTEVQNLEEFFDIKRRNIYFENDIGSRDFPLENWPVTAVSEVALIYRDNEGVISGTTVLTLDSGYFLDNLTRGCIVKIPKDYDIAIGIKTMRVTYNYGYSSVPQDITDFCNYYAAAIADGAKSVPVNDDGNPLAEVEIGRYREKYANPSTVYATKYGTVLKEMADNLVVRYKIWE